MRLFYLSYRNRPIVGIEIEKGMVNFTEALQAYYFVKHNRFSFRIESLFDLIERGLFAREAILRVLDYLETHDLWQNYLISESYTILPPLPQTGKIICLGRNYAAHAQETGNEPPKEPILFVKTRSTVIGPDQAIEIPLDAGRVDHEIELAVVIGKRAKKVSRQEAREVVAGYTIFNDVTARALQREDIAAQKPWYRSKNFDTFGPMGPCIVSADEFAFPPEVNLSLRVNGEVRQQANTRDMIFDVPALIEAISHWITLQPGDLISTGTPEGISELHPGDVVEAEIEGIGVLKNPVKSGE